MKHYATFEITSKVECWCGECDGTDYEPPKYFKCAKCGRICPYCYGASDKYYELCDLCAFIQMSIDEESEQMDKYKEALQGETNVK